MARTKTTRSFYISEEANQRLAELAEADYNQPSRYLEKLIDQAWRARAPDTPAVARSAPSSSRPQAGKKSKG